MFCGVPSSFEPNPSLQQLSIRLGVYAQDHVQHDFARMADEDDGSCRAVGYPFREY